MRYSLCGSVGGCAIVNVGVSGGALQFMWECWECFISAASYCLTF